MAKASDWRHVNHVHDITAGGTMELRCRWNGVRTGCIIFFILLHSKVLENRFDVSRFREDLEPPTADVNLALGNSDVCEHSLCVSLVTYYKHAVSDPAVICCSLTVSLLTY